MSISALPRPAPATDTGDAKPERRRGRGGHKGFLFATPFDDVKYRRHMHRTTLEGDVPVMAETAAFRPADAAAAE